MLRKHSLFIESMNWVKCMYALIGLRGKCVRIRSLSLQARRTNSVSSTHQILLLASIQQLFILVYLKKKMCRFSWLLRRILALNVWNERSVTMFLFPYKLFISKVFKRHSLATQINHSEFHARRLLMASERVYISDHRRISFNFVWNFCWKFLI